MYREAVLRMKGGGRNGRQHRARRLWTGRRAVLFPEWLGSWLDAVGGR